MEKKINLTFVTDIDGKESIDIKTSTGIDGMEAIGLLQKASNQLFATLIVNTVKKEMKDGPRIVAAGDGHVGIDPRLLRSQ